MNLLIFGPNGSGKGTQGALIKERLGVAHVESGVLFREAIAAGTKLGLQAKAFTERGELVPDELTIPMVLERLSAPDCAAGWLLDGFPRTPAQARALHEALRQRGMALDAVIEIVLPRADAAARIMGRRICAADGNHPNNLAFPAIAPQVRDGREVCRVCGAALSARADDQDAAAIGRRHDIYYDRQAGTLGAVEFFRQVAARAGAPRVIAADGGPPVREVTAAIFAQLPAPRSDA